MSDNKSGDPKTKPQRGALNNLDEKPAASVGLATGLQQSGTNPGGSPGAGAGSLGQGGGSTGGAGTGNVAKQRKSRA